MTTRLTRTVLDRAVLALERVLNADDDQQHLPDPARRQIEAARLALHDAWISAEYPRT